MKIPRVKAELVLDPTKCKEGNSVDPLAGEVRVRKQLKFAEPTQETFG